jgi:hypothetical protein
MPLQPYDHRRRCAADERISRPQRSTCDGQTARLHRPCTDARDDDARMVDASQFIYMCNRIGVARLLSRLLRRNGEVPLFLRVRTSPSWKAFNRVMVVSVCCHDSLVTADQGSAVWDVVRRAMRRKLRMLMSLACCCWCAHRSTPSDDLLRFSPSPPSSRRSIHSASQRIASHNDVGPDNMASCGREGQQGNERAMAHAHRMMHTVGTVANIHRTSYRCMCVQTKTACSTTPRWRRSPSPSPGHVVRRTVVRVAGRVPRARRALAPRRRREQRRRRAHAPPPPRPPRPPPPRPPLLRQH